MSRSCSTPGDDADGHVERRRIATIRRSRRFATNGGSTSTTRARGGLKPSRRRCRRRQASWLLQRKKRRSARVSPRRPGGSAARCSRGAASTMMAGVELRSNIDDAGLHITSRRRAAGARRRYGRDLRRAGTAARSGAGTRSAWHQDDGDRWQRTSQSSWTRSARSTQGTRVALRALAFELSLAPTRHDVAAPSVVTRRRSAHVGAASAAHTRHIRVNARPGPREARDRPGSRVRIVGVETFAPIRPSLRSGLDSVAIARSRVVRRAPRVDAGDDGGRSAALWRRPSEGRRETARLRIQAQRRMRRATPIRRSVTCAPRTTTATPSRPRSECIVSPHDDSVVGDRDSDERVETGAGAE